MKIKPLTSVLKTAILNNTRAKQSKSVISLHKEENKTSASRNQRRNSVTSRRSPSRSSFPSGHRNLLRTLSVSPLVDDAILEAHSSIYSSPRSSPAAQPVSEPDKPSRTKPLPESYLLMHDNFLRFGKSTAGEDIWLSIPNPQHPKIHRYTTKASFKENTTMRDPRPRTGFSSFVPELHKILARRMKGRNDYTNFKWAVGSLYQNTQRLLARKASSGLAGAGGTAAAADVRTTTTEEFVGLSFSAERMAKLKVALLVPVCDPRYEETEED